MRGAQAFRNMAERVRSAYGVPVSWMATRGEAWYRANGLTRPRGGSWHDTGEAFDVKIDPRSAKGQQIAAALRAQGFGVLEETTTGTGPHLHVSPNGR